MERLALLGPSWPFRGGIARTTTALAQVLLARGQLRLFLVPREQYPRWLYPGAQDRDENACPHLPQAEACFSLFRPTSWRNVRKRLVEKAISTLIVPIWTATWVPLIFYIAASVKHLLCIVHNSHDHEATFWSKILTGKLLGRAQGFLTHARWVARHLASRFPHIPLVVHPLPPLPAPVTAREEARQLLGIPKEAVAFLYFGLIRPYKGVEVLLAAFRRLGRDLPAFLLLAGEAWEEKRKLEALLRATELAGRVRAELAWVPEEQASLWFSAADVAVLPYLRATGSAVAAQALAYGLPILGTQVGGIADVVRDGESGLLVAPGNPDLLASAMVRLLEPQLRRKLAEKAQAQGKSLSWEGYADALLSLCPKMAQHQE